MTLRNPRVLEHLATKADLSLEDFCTKLKEGLNLPQFECNAENETEWGLAQIGDFEINISRPYTLGTLQEWDSSTPEGCNFAVLLIVSETAPLEQDAEWTSKELVPRYAQMIANIIGSDVYHHSVWAKGKFSTRTLTTYGPSTR
jgi:hypothetical protein